MGWFLCDGKVWFFNFMGIYKVLRMIFCDFEWIYEWILKGNVVFGGKFVFDIMLNGELIDIMCICCFFDFGWGGW